MSAEIWRVVTKAIKTRTPDLLIFDDVDPSDFDHVYQSLRDRSNHFEESSFRIHWIPTHRILKIVMPSKLHECVASWLFGSITKARVEGLMSEVWDDTMDIMPSPEYKNFRGQFACAVKEPDFAFIPLVGPGRSNSAEFPSVVLESGWSESATRLREDARLWQEGSTGAVRVVLQVKFYQPNRQGQVRLVLSISRAHPSGQLSSLETYIILPAQVPAQQSPSVSLAEFYAGDCPVGIDPATAIPLDLERLRLIATRYIIQRGNLPA